MFRSLSKNANHLVRSRINDQVAKNRLDTVLNGEMPLNEHGKDFVHGQLDNLVEDEWAIREQVMKSIAFGNRSLSSIQTTGKSWLLFVADRTDWHDFNRISASERVGIDNDRRGVAQTMCYCNQYLHKNALINPILTDDVGE